MIDGSTGSPQVVDRLTTGFSASSYKLLMSVSVVYKFRITC